MADAQVRRQSKDTVLKLIATALGDDFFARFNLKLPRIVAGLPTEFPQLEVRTQQSDLLFRLADDGGVLHLEAQTQYRAEHLLRFANYHLAAYAEHGGPVHTIIVYGAGVRSAPSALRTGGLTFRVHNIFIGRKDAEAVLRRLQRKAARAEAYTSADRIDLILSPLMKRRRLLEQVLADAVTAARSLPTTDQELTVGALLGLAYNYVGEETISAILEGLGMPNPLQTLIEDSITKGLVEGRQEGARKLLRSVLESRFSIIPPSLEQRIATADVDELDELARRAAIVERVEDM